MKPLNVRNYCSGYEFPYLKQVVTNIGNQLDNIDTHPYYAPEIIVRSRPDGVIDILLDVKSVIIRHSINDQSDESFLEAEMWFLIDLATHGVLLIGKNPQ